MGVVAVAHAFQSSKTDPVDTTKVGKTKWNAAHSVQQDAAGILGAPGAGSTVVLTASQALDLIGSTRGQVLARGAAVWGALPLGTSGYQLQSDGTDVVWAGFLQSGASAVTRTWQNKARDIVCVFDFMTEVQIADVKARTIFQNVTTAVQAALNAIGGDSSALYFPSGTYLLTSGALAKTLAAGTSLKVYGDGLDATVLLFPTNGDGLNFTYTSNSFAWIGGNSLIVEDLAFVTNVQNTGSAVTVNGAALIGDPNRPTIFERVGCRGTLNNNSYWANGIEANDLQNLVVNDFYYFSYALGLLGTAVACNGSSNPAHPTIVNVHNLNMQFGAVGVNCTGYIEGLNVTQCNLTQVDYGILVDTAAALPQFSCHGSQINAKSANIQIVDAEACQIVGNLLFVTDTAPAGNPAIVGNFKYSTIAGNTLIGLSAVNVPNGIILQSGATDNYIGDNVFKGFTTNVWLQAGANNNRVGPNRHVNGTPVVDSGAGNIWFTETATAYSPGVSDGASLGTTALKWADAFFADGAVINFNGGDVTLTHSTAGLTVGGDGAVTFVLGTAVNHAVVRGHTAALAFAIPVPQTQFHGTDNDSASVGHARWSADAAGPVFNYAKSRGASAGTFTVVQSGDTLGQVVFRGADGTALITGAAIFAKVDGTPGANDMPGRIHFATTPDGAAAATDRMILDSQGLLSISGGSLGRGAPVTKTADFTLAATENHIINNRAATNTATLPAASAFPGREVFMKTIQPQTVVSASSNVVPSTSATAGTAILPATDGAWALLVSDGTNWIIVAANPLV